jgi:DNA-binding transcriptional regulator YiaG
MTAQEIQALRSSLGLSRSELAARIGVSKRTVEFWEQGRGFPCGPAEKALEGIRNLRILTTPGAKYHD